MNNLDFGFYFSILKQRLPYVIAITLSVLLAAIAATRFMPPVYTAAAKLLVEAPQIPAELARSTVPMGATAQLMILQQEMTTHSALLELASKLEIYSSSAARPSDEDIVNDLRARISFDQLQLDGQDPLQRVAIYSVSFDAPKADLAAKVANELVTRILEKNQRERTFRAGKTLQFFDQKVASLDTTLKQLEADILKFKKENRESLPESLDFYRSEQGNMQDRYASLEKEASELRSKRSALVVAYTNTDQIPGVAQQLTPDQQMLVDLNRALSEQLTIFTEDSPTVVTLRTRIAELQKRLVAARRPVDTQKKSPDANKEPFGLDVQLTEIDQRLADIAEERAMIATRIESLAKSISQSPASEAGLTAMLRNRDNVQKQYNAAIAQRAEASTGEQLEMRSDGERFSLLESAIAPSKPMGPKRRLIVGGGGLAGLGLGLGLVILLELLNKTVRRRQDIVNLLQAEPFGTIPVIKASAKRRKWRPSPVVSAAALLMVCAFLSTVMFSKDYSPMLPGISSPSGRPGLERRQLHMTIFWDAGRKSGEHRV